MRPEEQAAWLRQIARQLRELTDEATLFAQLNDLEPARVQELLDGYRWVERRYSPVNLLRYEVLNQLEEGRPPLSPADVELIRQHIENRDTFFFKKYGARLAQQLADSPATEAFRGYRQGPRLAYFRLFYRFFYGSRESRLVRDALRELGEYLAAHLPVPAARLRVGDFNNGNYSGGTRCWLAFHPSEGDDSLVLEITPEGFRCAWPEHRDARAVDWFASTDWAETLDLLGRLAAGYRRTHGLDVVPEPAQSATVAEPVPGYAPESYDRSEALKDLFFSATQFDAWLAALRTKKNLLLQGPPGVGKTFVAQRLAQVLTGYQNGPTTSFVQFHPSFAYEEFIEGYRPDGQDGFAVRTGLFYAFVQRARRYPTQPHAFVIDELNRGNVSSIFGELLVLLEADKRGPAHAVRLPNSGEAFFLPENLYVLGTLNTADRSLAPLDYALRRRFAVATLVPQFNEAFADYLQRHQVPPNVANDLIRELNRLNERIRQDRQLGPGFEIGHSYFSQPTVPVDDWLRAVLELELAPLLQAYWADDSSVADAQIEILFGLLG
jgi:5-methylcytosine-specific restriction protein B